MDTITLIGIRKAMQYVFGCDGRYICNTRPEVGDQQRDNLLMFMCGTMYQISDVNDRQAWQIWKINDNSRTGIIEILKQHTPEEALVILAEWRKELL